MLGPALASAKQERHVAVMGLLNEVSVADLLRSHLCALT